MLTDTLIFPNGEKYGELCNIFTHSITIVVIIVGQYMKQSDKIERQGSGTHYSNDGTEFSGIWVNDKMNGEGTVLSCVIRLMEYVLSGTIKYPDGSVFTVSH